jgi:DNA-binding PadR family transcriptional regulator
VKAPGNTGRVKSKEAKATGSPASQAKIVTDRDRAVLRDIGQNGIATFAYIKAHYWPDQLGRTCRERLSLMEKAGWITKEYVSLRKPGELTFSLTRLGAEHFTRPEQQRFTLGPLARHEIRQQLDALDARVSLVKQYESLGYRLLDWHNERELRSRQTSTAGDEIADCLASFVNEASGQVVELDIEIDGQYFGQMLEKKIAALAATGRPSVWATSAGRARRIRQAVAAFPNITVLVLD